MKLCKDHWAALRGAIDERGLTPFVAKSGLDAATRLTATGDKETFEPLMGANMAIVANLMSAFGPAVLGDSCPICVAIRTCECGLGGECPFNSWIGRAADDQLKIAKDLGLIVPS